jgi:ATP synthase protein I
MGDNFRKRDHEQFEEQVSEKTRRKLRSRGREGETIWYGLGLFGIIGWSVVVPTLIGLAVGIWIDTRWPGEFSWTLTLMTGGLLLGGFIAYTWVKSEQENIEKESGGEQRKGGKERDHE